MSELLPAATRATGLGLGYNIGVTLFGGMGPVIMTWLGGIAIIGDLAPGYYLTLVCVLSLGTLITIRRTSAASYEGVTEWRRRIAKGRLATALAFGP